MISQEQINKYNEDGAICIRGAISNKWIDQMLNHIDNHFKNGCDPETVEIGERAYSDRYLYKKNEWMQNFVFSSGIAEIAGRLMESTTASVYFDHIFIREANSPEITPWHQDRPYWPFIGNQIASVWAAFTASGQNSSAVSFIKGSHKWNKVFKPQAFSEADSLDGWIRNAQGENIPDFWENSNDVEILSWDTNPGDVIIFGGDIIHAASPNMAKTGRRVAVSTRFIGDAAIWDPRIGTDPIITQNDVNIQPGDFGISDEKAFPIAWRG